ncbi:S-adenosyl-L-methionine-dependent tRNA 4-demethylwyosine synthase [Nymphon striatum]|nr:S-adenosyl-L-methionine-dependent tRNA 4-demethylwyosine synthase [Nymphon striatum]
MIAVLDWIFSIFNGIFPLVIVGIIGALSYYFYKRNYCHIKKVEKLFQHVVPTKSLEVSGTVKKDVSSTCFDCSCEEKSESLEESGIVKKDVSSSCFDCSCEEKSESLEESGTVKKDVSTYADYSSQEKSKIKIFYGSQTGKSEEFARILVSEAEAAEIEVDLVNLKDYEPEDQLCHERNICIFLIPTYTDGQPPDNAKWFCTWLLEASTDFRTQKSLLETVRYTVLGLGNSMYQDNFNKVAKSIDHNLHKLGAKRAMPLYLCDENTAQSKHKGLEGDYEAWKSVLLQFMADGGNGEVQYESSDEEPDSEIKEDDLVDVEEIGNVMNKMKKSLESKEPKEMINPSLRKSLTKQGYKLVGTHSGVKLCRWTKSMLRGRGGCYKHTFYGIESHRCMETTPSLACANKCVFCWRHHSNPVGTEWKWKMDQPELIINGALENHYKMIKEFKGVPGVQPERLAEGMKVLHCALSLVGEPIMYPEINRFVDMLHEKEISSFLVTNAQFPEAITNMSPVTQLYVSVDASTKDSLKKIDRPLFRDFWERFLDSLKALSDKGQRTVYRLTLVKAWNTDELTNYAKLVSLGNPDFIEVKGVTYCGSSKASTLTMQNVPWHEEVLGFVQELVDQLPDYEIACEHEHSNCVLIANKKFKVEGKWHTWIDYTRFHELIKDFKKSNKTFSSIDYMAETPSWSVIGSKEHGFDPIETRWYRKNRKDISGC